jgi:predicted DNA repair protein MutK
MSVGLLAVVDDILSAALKASAKSAGVVIDDAAVTPQYVQGISPARELPVVLKITLGSLANKFVIIIPIALLLTAFAPWVLPFLLIIGGTYLCFEGAEKVLEWFGLHHGGEDEGARNENTLVWGAIRTDLILSTEIMLISLSNLEEGMSIGMTLLVLAVIALVMTGVVYGAVALLVKIDDIGLKMAKNSSARVRHTGARIVRAMPAVFRVISVIGTVAMLWVGGHLLLANLGEVGLHFFSDMLHGIHEFLSPAGSVIAWIGETFVSAVAGLAVGLIVVGVVLLIGRMLGKKPSFTEGGESPVKAAAITP